MVSILFAHDMVVACVHGRLGRGLTGRKGWRGGWLGGGRAARRYKGWTRRLLSGLVSRHHSSHVRYREDSFDGFCGWVNVVLDVR